MMHGIRVDWRLLAAAAWLLVAASQALAQDGERAAPAPTWS